MGGAVARERTEEQKIQGEDGGWLMLLPANVVLALLQPVQPSFAGMTTALVESVNRGRLGLPRGLIKGSKYR